jgi:hypothetical protein
VVVNFFSGPILDSAIAIFIGLNFLRVGLPESWIWIVGFSPNHFSGLKSKIQIRISEVPFPSDGNRKLEKHKKLVFKFTENADVGLSDIWILVLEVHLVGPKSKFPTIQHLSFRMTQFRRWQDTKKNCFLDEEK